MQVHQHWVTGGNDSISSDNSKCFTKIGAEMGKFCEDNEDIGFKLCDDPIVEEDCVSKGEDYCWSRSDCYGIMFNKEWASANLGVKICKSSTLIEKDKKDWDLFLKCSKSK